MASLLPEKMSCVKFDKNNKCTTFDEEMPVPKVTGNSDVLVCVKLAGICHTDYDVIQDKYSAVDNVILGHEIVGIVAVLPKSYEGTEISVGDLVMVNSGWPCALTSRSCGSDDFVVIDNADQLDELCKIGETEDVKSCGSDDFVVIDNVDQSSEPCRIAQTEDIKSCGSDDFVVIDDVDQSNEPCEINQTEDNESCDSDDFVIIAEEPYKIGQTEHGGWAMYCKVKLSQLVRLSTLAKKVVRRGILCDPLSRVLYGLDRLNAVNFSKNSTRTIILGAGLIGLMFTGVLHNRGHRHATVIEENFDRRKIINNLKIGYRCVPWEKIYKEKQENLTKISFDYCIDCTGDPIAMQRGLSILRSGGTMLMNTICNPSQQNTMLLPRLDCFGGEYIIIASAYNTKASINKAMKQINTIVDKYIPKDSCRYFRLRDHRDALKKDDAKILKRYFAPDEDDVLE